MSFIYNDWCVLVQTQKYLIFCWYSSCFVYKITQFWLQISRCSCLYYLPSTEHPSDNGGYPSVVSEIEILLQSDRCQVKYVNTLLYPGSVSMRSSPDNGVLGTLIKHLTSKIALLLFTLICNRELFTISILFHITSR